MYSSQLLPTSSNRTMIFQVSGEILMLREDGSLLQSITRIMTFKKKSHNLIKQFWKFPSAWTVTGLQHEYLTCFDQNKEGRREHHFTNKKIQVCEEMAFALLSSPSSVLEQNLKPWAQLSSSHGTTGMGKAERIIHTLALTSSGQWTNTGIPHFQIHSVKRN